MEIYTDGACSGNPGPGGWAFCFTCGDEVIYQDSGYSEYTTNNKMEMMAVIKSLETFLEHSDNDLEVILNSDSKYIIDNLKYVDGWKRKNWTTSTGSTVKNIDEWKKIQELSGKINLRWQWVRGHSGNKFNEIVDELAKKQILSNRK